MPIPAEMGDPVQQPKDDRRKLRSRVSTIAGKASDLRSLCNADVAVVISEPEAPEPFVWPDPSTAGRIIGECCNAGAAEDGGKKRKASARDRGNEGKIAFLDGLLDEIRKRKQAVLGEYGRDLRLGRE